MPKVWNQTAMFCGRRLAQLETIFESPALASVVLNKRSSIIRLRCTHFDKNQDIIRTTLTLGLVLILRTFILFLGGRPTVGKVLC